ncbi:MAG: hypothetical protein P8X57_10905 [Cyclobacteriaceae bacterium]
MIVDLLLAVVCFYFMIPLVAGYFAHSYGRSFWLWFGISTFLPIITHFILIALVYYDESRTRPDHLNRRERVDQLFNNTFRFSSFTTVEMIRTCPGFIFMRGSE